MLGGSCSKLLIPDPQTVLEGYFYDGTSLYSLRGFNYLLVQVLFWVWVSATSFLRVC